MERVITEHIEATPGVCGGKPRLVGRRIRVQDIVVEHEVHGRCPDEIVDGYDGVTLADVYAALAYYFDHREEIRRDMDEDEAFVARFKKQYPSQRCAGSESQHADADSVPPG